MNLAAGQLDALVAIADHGTFEAAARALQVTPSAISQRVKALESASGQVLVRRTLPCRITVAGEALVRLGRQTRLLYDEAQVVLAAQPISLAVAVNADSLAGWFRDVIADVAGWPHSSLTLHVEDQAWSGDLLRSGECLAAVTSEPVAVQGCSVEPLGVLRYAPAATIELTDRWRTGGGGPDWARMPVVVFNAKDDLQHEVLREHGAQPVVQHRVPTSADFHEAVRLGLGWGMLPETQLLPDLASGRLVRLESRRHIDVVLHWQRWRLDSAVLTRLTDAVRSAARTHLRPPVPSGRRP